MLMEFNGGNLFTRAKYDNVVMLRPIPCYWVMSVGSQELLKKHSAWVTEHIVQVAENFEGEFNDFVVLEIGMEQE